MLCLTKYHIFVGEKLLVCYHCHEDTSKICGMHWSDWSAHKEIKMSSPRSLQVQEEWKGCLIDSLIFGLISDKGNLIQRRSTWIQGSDYLSGSGIFQDPVQLCRDGLLCLSNTLFNSLRPRRNEQHFADDIFKRIFFNENVWISIKISLKFVPNGLINNIPALVQIMAWRRSGDKPLS